MAFLEASLLFAEASRNGETPLPALSERISFAILRVADALATVMEAHAQDNDLWPMVNAQLPPALAASEHAAKLPEMLPWEYQKSVRCPPFETVHHTTTVKPCHHSVYASFLRLDT